MDTLFNLFLIVSAIHGFIFSSFLFYQKKKTTSKSLLFLNLMIVCLSLNNLQSWLLAKQDSLQISYLEYFQFPWHFLIAPLFISFLCIYLELNNRLLILKASVVAFIISVIFQGIYLFQIRELGIANYAFHYERYTTIEETVSFLVSISIFGYASKLIYTKEILKKQVLSYDNLNWLKTFIVIAGVSYILWAVALSFEYVFNFKQVLEFHFPLRLMTTLLIYWLGYQALFVIRQTEERKHLRNSTVTLGSSKDQKSDKFQQVEHFILDNKRYLDTQLTLENLANDLVMSTSSLSKLINEHSPSNFNYLINSYRVAYAQKLLLDPTYSAYTITSIALESGFNSKSTFYTAFKKHSGQTPTEYREHVKNTEVPNPANLSGNL